MTGGRSPAGSGRPAAVIYGSSPAVRADAHPGKKAAAARLPTTDKEGLQTN